MKQRRDQLVALAISAKVGSKSSLTFEQVEDVWARKRFIRDDAYRDTVTRSVECYLNEEPIWEEEP